MQSEFSKTEPLFLIKNIPYNEKKNITKINPENAPAKLTNIYIQKNLNFFYKFSLQYFVFNLPLLCQLTILKPKK